MAEPKTIEPEPDETGETGGAHEDDTRAGAGYAERQPVDREATEEFVDEAERLDSHNRAAGDVQGTRGPADDHD